MERSLDCALSITCWRVYDCDIYITALNDHSVCYVEGGLQGTKRRDGDSLGSLVWKMMVDWTRIVDSSGNGAASDSGNIWWVNDQSLV